ncbi:MAG: tetratricopeptide repeat protein [Candidatus Promineifilaceae bacterium]
MPTLRLYCFGRFELTYQDVSLPRPATVNSQSLLAYLACNRVRPTARDKLIDLFWGERPDHRARRSLSTALWHIRRCLPNETYITADNQTVQLTGQLWLDVDAFYDHADTADLASLETAVSLYRGEFLDGFYNEWVIDKRYQLHGRYLETLRSLMIGYEEAGRYQQTLNTALLLLDQDPLQESANRAAMRNYARIGQRNTALEHFQHFREIIRQELDVEPMPETAKLAEEIGSGRFPAEPFSHIPLEPFRPAKMPSFQPTDTLSLPFFGRSREMNRLNDYWQNRQGGLLLISGEAGGGKSRLVQEFVRQLPGEPVLLGRCYEFERLLPYQPFAEALRPLLTSFTTADWNRLPAWTTGELAHLLPELSEKFGEQTTADLQPDRTRLFNAVSRLLALLSEYRPLLLILEDLHWATESTLQLLHYLVHQAIPSLLVIGTFRREIVGPDHPLVDVERQLGREKLSVTLALSRLSRDAVTEIISGLAVETLETNMAGTLFAETEGNPFFLTEIIRTLVDTGSETIADGGRLHPRTAERPLPPTITSAVLARIKRLPIEAQEGLRLAAILGREFDFDLLKLLWGRDDDAILEQIELWLRHFLIEEGTGIDGRDYAFSHHKLQEVLYVAIPRRRRQQLHSRAAAAMEALYPTEKLAGELAFHYRQGCKHDPALIPKAVHYLQSAGEHAAAQYALDEAAAYFSQALALLSEGDHRRLPLLLAREKVLDSQGNRQAQVEDLSEMARLTLEVDAETKAMVALRQTNFAIVTGRYNQAAKAAQTATLTETADLKIEALIQWGLAHFHQGEYEMAVLRIQEALTISRGEKLPRLEARCLTVLGLARWQQSRYEEAKFALKAALAICRLPEINDSVGEANASGNLGIICRYQGDFYAARSYFQQALSVWQEIGHRRGESLYLTNLGVIAMDTADYPTARDYYQQSLTIAREIGERENEQLALNDLCSVSIFQGNFQQALELAEAALAICQEIGSRRSEGISHMNLGDAYKNLGQLGSAESHYQLALSIRREQGDRRGEGLALCGLGETAVLREDHNRAIPLLRQALAIMQEIENKGEECRVLVGLGEGFLAAGELEKAAVYLEKTLQLSQELNHKWLESRTQYELAKLALAMGDQKTAVAYCQQAIDLAQQIGAGALEAKAQTLLTLF